MQVFATSPAAVYTGIGNAFTRISSTEGMRALWRGVSSVIMGAGPAHAVHFGTYETIKELAGGNVDGVKNQWIATCVCIHSLHHRAEHLSFLFHGSTSGCFRNHCQRCTHEPIRWYGTDSSPSFRKFFDPFSSVIKQRMQMHQSEFRSALQCARTVYHKEGLNAFYVSYPTTLTMTVPFTAVQFTVYEQLKTLLNPSGVYSPSTHIVSGGLAGAVAGAVTTPLDVAKTLLQTRGNSQDMEIRHARGLKDAFRIIWARDGVKGFARGLAPRVLTFMPSNALCWMSYEFFSTCRFVHFFFAMAYCTVCADRACRPFFVEAAIRDH
jgi:solute carrier family 25 (mitochondrial iron transporter), member 28/37